MWKIDFEKTEKRNKLREINIRRGEERGGFKIK